MLVMGAALAAVATDPPHSASMRVGPNGSIQRRGGVGSGGERPAGSIDGPASRQQPPAFDADAATLAGPGITIDRWVIAGGGGVSGNGGLEIAATAGEASAGTLSVAGSLRLESGFWAFARTNLVFRDDFETGDLSRWSASPGE